MLKRIRRGSMSLSLIALLVDTEAQVKEISVSN